jgi:hypothetical protein
MGEFRLNGTASEDQVMEYCSLDPFFNKLLGASVRRESIWRQTYARAWRNCR